MYDVSNIIPWHPCLPKCSGIYCEFENCGQAVAINGKFICLILAVCLYFCKYYMKMLLLPICENYKNFENFRISYDLTIMKKYNIIYHDTVKLRMRRGNIKNCQWPINTKQFSYTTYLTN